MQLGFTKPKVDLAARQEETHKTPPAFSPILPIVIAVVEFPKTLMSSKLILPDPTRKHFQTPFAKGSMLIWYILRAHGGSHLPTVRPNYIP